MTKNKKPRRKKPVAIEEVIVLKDPATLEITEVEVPLLLMEGTVPDMPTAEDDAKIIVDLYKESVVSWLREAPVASSDLTLQWYGMEFQPSYKRWLDKGYMLAKQ